MEDNRFDLVVIGAGPGGYVAALRAAQLGMKVACVEKEDRLGGTCLRVGCIPSKALLDSSHVYHETKHRLADHGIRVQGVELDLAAMMGRKDKVVSGLSTGIQGLFKKNKVTRVTGTAKVASPGVVEVQGPEGVRRLEAARILVATGSVPRPLPGFEFDGKRLLSSTEALALPAVPGRMVVLGAGAIGLELGSVWSRLGTKVVVVEAMERILPGMDREMTRGLQRILEKQGLAFRLDTRAKAWRADGESVVVDLEHGGETAQEVADVVLVAIGRVAAGRGLGLEELGVELDRGGRVVVDAGYRTRVPGIYAIGDVIAGPMLAHKAEEEGIAAVELMAGHRAHVNYGAIPMVVYTHPELASVGLDEEAAGEGGRAVRVGRFPFAASGRARCMNDTDGLVKVIADAASDRILGIHILGARAADMIAEGAVAMEFGASAEDLAISVHAHPTLPEAVKEAALAALGRPLHA